MSNSKASPRTHSKALDFVGGLKLESYRFVFSQPIEFRTWLDCFRGLFSKIFIEMELARPELKGSIEATRSYCKELLDSILEFLPGSFFINSTLQIEHGNTILNIFLDLVDSILDEDLKQLKIPSREHARSKAMNMVFSAFLDHHKPS